MPDKQATHKSVGVLVKTYDDIQEIAKQLSIEKGVTIKVAPALEYVINFYLQAHQKGKK